MNKSTGSPIRPYVRMAVMLLVDILLFAASVGLAYYIYFEVDATPWQMFAPLQKIFRFSGDTMPWHLEALQRNMPMILCTYAACYILGGVYRILWRYAGERELLRIFGLCVLACALTMIFNKLFNKDLSHNLSKKMLALTGIFALFLTGGFRLICRSFVRLFNSASSASPRNALLFHFKAPVSHRRVLILGAGEAGAYTVSVCQSDPTRFGVPIGFLDDDPGKIRMRLHGLPVLGRIEEVGRIVQENGIDSIIIAMPTLKGDAMRKVVELANATRRSVYMFSSPEALDGQKKPNTIRELDVTDFLSREEVTLDNEGIRAYVQGKTVLVTGGGGSIGSEICRQLVRFNPEKLLIFDIYENTAYELLYDLRLRYPETLCPVEILIGSIRDKARLDEVFSTYKPHVVFHAAAHKHVSLMEVSPAEAVKNNVFGTWNVLAAASEHGVERYVQLSTDKAVNPSNVMGATKRVTEMLVQLFARNTKMKCMAVRFGNVLGSHGSVIPLWERQIRQGGPVTVMDPQITRYFMTIPEAAQLVMQAGALAQSGAIYVLDMGTPCRMMDVAEKLIRFYGFEPRVDMQIKVTGLRKGEKMYEELMMDDEHSKMTRTAHDKIFVAPPIPMDDGLFRKQLDELSKAAAHNDEQVISILEEIVPTYTPNRQKAAI